MWGRKSRVRTCVQQQGFSFHGSSTCRRQAAGHRNKTESPALTLAAAAIHTLPAAPPQDEVHRAALAGMEEEMRRLLCTVQAHAQTIKSQASRLPTAGAVACDGSGDGAGGGGAGDGLDGVRGWRVGV